MHPKEVLKALRLENCIISAFGVFAGYVLATGALELGPRQFLLMASAFAITGAGNAINDFYDKEIDKRLAKEKNTGKETYWVSLALFTTGIISAAFVNTHAILIASSASIALIIYAGAMQKLKYLGNWLVAGLTGLTIFYGATITKNYHAVFFPAMSALFANGAREIIKDLEDLKGDKGFKVTLPMLTGHEKIKKIVLLTYLFSIAMAFAAIFSIKQKPIYLAGILITAIFLAMSYNTLTKNDFTSARRLAKYGMATALASFIIASI